MTDSVNTSRSGSPSTPHRKPSQDAHPLVDDDGNTAPDKTASKAAASNPIPYKARTRQSPSSRASTAMSGAPVLTSPKNIIPTVAATLSNTVPSPTSSERLSGNPSKVASKLKLQSLYSSLAVAGLQPNSAGWLLVQKLVAEPASDTQHLLGTILGSGKVCLLLPLEEMSASDIDMDFIKRHTILRDEASIITLTGLRGIVSDNTISLQSAGADINTDDIAAFESVLSNLAQHTSLTTKPGPSATDIVLGMPIDIYLSTTPSGAAAGPAKPPTRRSLVSLFGGQRAPSYASSDPAGLAPAAIMEVSSTAQQRVTAWPVQRILRHEQLSAAITSHEGSRIRTRLENQDRLVKEMTLSLLSRFDQSAHTNVEYVSSPEVDTPHQSLVGAHVDTLTSVIQEFYFDARSRMEDARSERTALQEALNVNDYTSLAESADNQSLDEELEELEAFLCEELYEHDRIEDEALSSRIAALNMLDLSLKHLGVSFDDASDWSEHRQTLSEGLEAVITSCISEFSSLSNKDCRSPAAKLDVLIRVHKSIADSLGTLPPIRLISEDEDNDVRGPPATLELKTTPASLRDNPSVATEVKNSEAATELPEEKTPKFLASQTASSEGLPIPSIQLPKAASTIEGYSNLATSTIITRNSDTLETPFVGTSLKRPESDRTIPSSKISADAILPLLIYAVVQANPYKLVSNVLFVQRFRSDHLMRGEGEYCLTNMDAVRAFLTNCDIASLGLTTDKLALPTSPVHRSRMRDHAAQSLDHMVGSAGKVLGLAGDIGLGGVRIMGGLLTRTGATFDARQPRTVEDVQSVLSGGDNNKQRSLRDALFRRGTVASVKPRIETEMANVIPASPPTGETGATADNGEPQKAAEPVSTNNTLASRLAGLPGLGRLGAASPGPSTASNAGSHSTSPAKGGIFAALTGPLTFPASQPARPTSIHSISANSQIDRIAPATGTPDSRPLSPTLSTLDGRDRSASFMSHASHHDYLNSQVQAGRTRSDSNASYTSDRLVAAANRQDLASRLANIAASKHAHTTSASSISSGKSGHRSRPVANEAIALGDKIMVNLDPPIQKFMESTAEDLRMGDIELLLADYKRLAIALQQANAS